MGGVIGDASMTGLHWDHSENHVKCYRVLIDNFPTYYNPQPPSPPLHLVLEGGVGGPLRWGLVVLDSASTPSDIIEYPTSLHEVADSEPSNDS